MYVALFGIRQINLLSNKIAPFEIRLIYFQMYIAQIGIRLIN